MKKFIMYGCFIVAFGVCVFSNAKDQQLEGTFHPYYRELPEREANFPGSKRDSIEIHGAITSSFAAAFNGIIFNFYPNPAKDIIQVRSNHGGLTYSIMDTEGRIKQEGRVQVFISLTSLEKGMYFFTIRSAREIVVKKLLIE